jgi:hypothetical protein
MKWNWLELNSAISTAIYKPLKTVYLQNLYFIITCGFSRADNVDRTVVNSAELTIVLKVFKHLGNGMMQFHNAGLFWSMLWIAWWVIMVDAGWTA